MLRIYIHLAVWGILMSALPDCPSDEFCHISPSPEAVDVQFVQQSDLCTVASIHMSNKVRIERYSSLKSYKHESYSILDEEGNALRLLELSHARYCRDAIWGVVTVQQTVERVRRLLFRIGGGKIQTEALGEYGNSPEFSVVGLSEGVNSVEICLAHRKDGGVLNLQEMQQPRECQIRSYVFGSGGVFTELMSGRRDLRVNCLMFPTSRGLVTEERINTSCINFRLLSSQGILGHPIKLTEGLIGATFYGLINSGQAAVYEILNDRGERLLFRDDLMDATPANLVLDRGQIHGETKYALDSKGDLFFATRYARSIELGKVSIGTGKSSEISVLRPAVGLEFQTSDVSIDLTGCLFVLTTEGAPIIID